MSDYRMFVVVVITIAVLGTQTASAQEGLLPSPLRLADVVRVASERRDEIRAAHARARAGDARPAIVSALDDPMLAPAINHLPFALGGADVNVTIEQRIPLSGLRGHRRDAARAEAARLRADADRTTLDTGAEAAAAFLMLQERQRMAGLVSEQLVFAQDVVVAANARYASGTAPQSDVLRAEVEVARLDAIAGTLTSQVDAAAAMLNTSLAIDVDRPVPPLAASGFGQPPPTWAAVRAAAISRPELTAGRADVQRTTAEVEVMRDMFRPMATIRTGPAYSMAEGGGWMAMVGVSLPIWRGKLRAGVAEAEAMRAMSEADLAAMTRMIEGQAATALHDLHAARTRQAALVSDVLPRARMAIEPAVAGYTAGQLPLVAVIEAVQVLWSVQSDVIAADTDLGLAWVRLGRALGSYEGMF